MNLFGNKANFTIRINVDPMSIPEKLGLPLEVLGEKIIDDANKTVPFDTGDLMRSGQVLPTSDDLEFELVYDRPYAVIHETAKDGTFNYQSPEARSGWVWKTIGEQSSKYNEFMRKKAEQQLGRR